MIAEAILCLALNVYHEARGEDHLGQLAVAQVTMNRVRSERYPDNVCDVVYQQSQFSWTHLIEDQRPHEREAWERAQLIAQEAYHGYVEVPGITEDTLHYHAFWVNPRWSRGRNPVAVIGVHEFYNL